MKRLNSVGLVLCSVLAITGCGGEGDGGNAPFQPGTTAEGVYGGTLTGGTSNAFNLLVLETGEYWALFGTQTASALIVAGFGQGMGASDNGTFTSTNFRDFSVVPAAAGRVDATYNRSTPSISGSVTVAGSSVGFSGGAIAGTLYNYDIPASIATISGTWSLTDLAGETVSLGIASTGAFTATSAGCVFTGSVTPRPSGKNVFNVALTFGSAPCVLAGQSATGIAVAYPLATGGTQLIVAAVDGARARGAAAVGVR